MFESHFYKIYGDPEFKGLKNATIFVLLGNHCVRLSGAGGRREGNEDLDRAYAQVVHTYLHCDGPERYLEDSLDLDKLPMWFMPRRSYSWSIEGDLEKGEGALLGFCLNWNQIVRDYFKATCTDPRFPNEKDNPHNQYNYIRATYLKFRKKYGDRLITTFDSHGPRTIHDKGLIEPSSLKFSLYLGAVEIALLKSAGFSGNYNDFFNQVLLNTEADIDATYSADTHALLNCLTKSDDGRMIYQVGVGGGGNHTLEPKRDFEGRDKLWYLRKHGCMVARVDLKDPKKIITHDFYTTDGLHLRFDKRSPLPVLPEKEDPRLTLLRRIVLRAYNEYYDSGLDSFIHGDEGVDRADHLWSFFHQCDAVPFQTKDESPCAYGYLKDLLEKNRLHLARESSLISLISKSMINFLGVTFEQFVTEPEEAFSKSLAERSPVRLLTPRHSRSKSHPKLKPAEELELSGTERVSVTYPDGQADFKEKMKQFTS